MKVALCLFGQPRFAELTYEYFFSTLINTMDIDVFFHSWWSKKMVGELYPCAPHAKASLFDEDMMVTENIPLTLVKLYNPKSYYFSAYEDYNFSPSQCQYYTQYAVSELLRDHSTIYGTKYDMVIRSRFDLACGQDIEFILDDSVWVPSCCPYSDRVNDMFSISNYDNYLKLSQVFLNLNEFEKEGKGEMEWALMRQIQKENLSIKRFKADYETFDVVRSTTKHKYV